MAAMGLCSVVATAVVIVHGAQLRSSPSERAAAAVAKMTMDEKLLYLHGPSEGPKAQCNTSATCAYVGNVPANTRLGIPPINMNDGPQGFRDNNHPGTTTAWPSGLTMAASWDRDAMLEWGEGMGKEFYGKGANVQLGPGLCLARVPRNGRNFEYLSGEDPFLGQELVQPVIKGIQSQSVVANAKHYVMNNQETNRHGVSAMVDERTRFEMYYPPFQGAVTAGVGSIMCSYNLVNGVAACGNEVTLKDDLKTKMNFSGYVMSDWGATHSASIMQGLDMEMPGAEYMNPENINAGIANGSITQKAVDDAVYRILLPMYSVGVVDAPPGSWDWSKKSKNCTTVASVQSARKLSAASTVLLKNKENLLPLTLSESAPLSIALIGFAGEGAVVHGGGSGSVVASYTVTPLEGLSNAVGTRAKIAFDNGTDLKSAAKLAEDSDVAIVFVGTLSHEGADRISLSLDDGCIGDSRPGRSDTQCQGNADNQNAMISAVAAANKKTVVVASIPGAILMPWEPEVAAILTNFMPGQQAGNAIADVILGEVNPSGKLPITMPNKENETDFSPEQWPGYPDPNQPAYADYSEKLLVGYRYYDYHNLSFSTGFPFGHGLSYTTFQYTDLKFPTTRSVSVNIKNTGSVAGAEVAQLYLNFPRPAGEPPNVLRGFEKIMLAPGQNKDVTFELDDKSFSTWDVNSHSWKLVSGEFGVSIGSSSRDLRVQGTIQV